MKWRVCFKFRWSSSKNLQCVQISLLICVKLFVMKTLIRTVGQLVFSHMYNMSPNWALWAFMTFSWKYIRVIFFFVCLFFFLTWTWTVHLLFPPLYSSVLKPDFNLCFSQIKRGGKVMSLGPDHVLLSIKFLFQSLELFWRENRANSLWLSLFEVPSLVFLMMNNWKDCFSFCNNKI